MKKRYHKYFMPLIFAFSLQKSKVWIKKRAEPNKSPDLFMYLLTAVYFLNFLLNPASPIKPEPKRSMVAGSGTEFISLTTNAPPEF